MRPRIAFIFHDLFFNWVALKLNYKKENAWRSIIASRVMIEIDVHIQSLFLVELHMHFF